MRLRGFREPPTPLPLKGTPSTTIKGELDKDKDPIPLITISCPSPGAPPPEVTDTPAIFPLISSVLKQSGPY